MAESSLFWTTGTSGDGASTYPQASLFKWLRRTMQTTVAAEAIVKNYANELAVTGTATPVSVNTGAAYVYGIPYENDTAVTFTIPTPVSGPTGHRIVLRADYSAHTVRLVLKSSADGTPTPPALTQSVNTTWEVPIATLSITTGGVITITDERSFIHMGTAVNTAMIDASAVTTAKIADSNVTTAKIADSAVTSAKIADGTIATADIADSAISTAKIADSAITSGKIAYGAVLTDNIADGTITQFDLGDACVIARTIYDGQVTAPKLAAGVAASNLGLNTIGNVVEIGSTSTPGTMYFDFHTGGTNIDFDSRISATGGNGSVGRGALSFEANELRAYTDSIIPVIGYRIGNNATTWSTPATSASSPTGYAITSKRIKMMPISFQLSVPTGSGPAYSQGVNLVLPSYFANTPMVVGVNTYDPSVILAVTVINTTTIKITGFFAVTSGSYSSIVNGSCLLIGEAL